MPFFLLAVALAALVSCKKAPPPAKEAPKSALERTTDRVRNTSPCSSVIPTHWSQSFPVPVVRSGALAYRIFYFGRDGNPRDGFDFHEPEGRAEFAPDGRVLDCRRTEAPAGKIPRLPDPPLAIEESVNRERRLFALTERVAGDFARGREPSAEGKRVVAEYLAAFKERADPAHLDDYRALNPAFWAWVEKNGGGTL